MRPLPFNIWRILAVVITTGFVALMVSGNFRYQALDQENMLLREQMTGLRLDLATEKGTVEVLTDALNIERARNGASEITINALSGSINYLQKLVSTDPELLRKYSKVYFLSENYSPAQLSSVDPLYLYQQNHPQLFHSGAFPHLEDMIRAAAQAGNTLKVVSAFRSFSEQAAVKEGYKVTYGAGTANQFSADQGYSEHQLGTAVDFNTPGTSGILAGFDKSAAFAWLNTNAYKFGFILSYPKGNTYYQFEPWHWRFVGVKLATDLHDQGKNFYDLDQRKIDEYLISLFN